MSTRSVSVSTKYAGIGNRIALRILALAPDLAGEEIHPTFSISIRVSMPISIGEPPTSPKRSVLSAETADRR